MTLARQRRRTRRITTGCITSLGILCLVAVCVAAPSGPQDPRDPQLEAASSGRVVRVRTGTGRSARIEQVPLEVYVARVLAGEGEPRAPEAAQEALAVAIRTFAAANLGRHRREGFDLCDSTHCQVLRAATPASRRAALVTAGQLLVYDGRPAEVFYSASCGGRSEEASRVWPGAIDHPYLVSAEDDVHGGDAPWVADVPVARIERALQRAGFAGRLRGVDVDQRSASGRVTRLRVSGMRPGTVSGEDFRAAIGSREIRSTAFAVRREGRRVRFTGRGYGHGVGLCVIGAGRRAARGESAARILAHYYPGLGRQSWTPLFAGVPQSSALDRLALRARDELAAALGIASPPMVTVDVHDSLDSFRQATGRPWWVAASVNGTTIDLAPLPVLEQGDGVEASIRRGVAEALVAEALSDRPAWVRIGAARYFSGAERQASAMRGACPTDAELTMAVSATSQREAELRAERCFAEALQRAGDWRRVRRTK
jgi:SpoIID/LytB domain protein